MTSRYVTPVPTDAATGVVADVYEQIADEFGISKPAALLTLSPAPELLAATWSLLRESLLAGDAPRGNKEIVAIGVSRRSRRITLRSMSARRWPFTSSTEWCRPC
jgi:hypothetical protein